MRNRRVLAIGILVLIAAALISCMLQPYSGEGYYHAVLDRMAALAASEAVLVTEETILPDPQHPIRLLSIKVPNGADKPRVLITGAIHGNEPISAEVAFRLAEYLAESFGTDQGITDLLQELVVDVIPVVNPWGMVHNSRLSANGTDLNRDFGYPDPDLPPDERQPLWLHPWDASSGFSSPESIAMRALCEARSYLFAVHGHTGAENINVPMDYLALEKRDTAFSDPEDYIETYMPIYPLMISAAEQYAATLRATGRTGFYATEGADWYLAYGTFSDWQLGAFGTPGFTVEYTDSQNSLSGADRVWAYHRDALLELLLLAGSRRQGWTDDTAGNPVSTVITAIRSADVQSRDPLDPTPLTISTRSAPDTGFFSLLLPDGLWELTIPNDEYVLRLEE